MKRLALRLMQLGGAFAFSRATTAGMARVLTYHNFSSDAALHPESVSARMLCDQLEYLRRNFHVVPLKHILQRIRDGKKLESHCVAVTIDDGRRNCYEVLFPLLKRFEIPATFFVVSSFISGEDWIWTDKILWLRDSCGSNELAGEHMDTLFLRLNKLHPEIRNKKIKELATRMGMQIPPEPPLRYAPCSWGELREMVASGLVEIGSHTVAHPILSSISDEESWNELTLSRIQIARGIGRDVDIFCFPNGARDDYRLNQVRQVEEAGYMGAVVTRFGMATLDADPYQLPRMGVGRRFDPLLFAKRLDGADYYQLKFRSSLGWKEA